MRVIEVNTIDGLAGLRLVWRSLLGETSGACFHQSCEWFETICQRGPSTFRPRVLVVTGPDDTIGILPLVQSVRETRWGSQQVIGLLSDPWSPFQGPIGTQPTATLMAGLRHLVERHADWDLLELGRLAPSVYQRTRTAFEVAGLPFYAVEEPGCVCLGAPWPAIQNSVQAESRRPQDGLSFKRHCPAGARNNDADPRWDLFEQCLELSQADREVVNVELLREIHAIAVRCGAADLNVLWHARKMVACCYNVHHNGVLLQLFGGSAEITADDAWMTRLVARMLNDDAKPVQHWLPRQAGGRELASEADATSQVTRHRLTHSRRQSVGRRLTDWLSMSKRRGPKLVT